MTERPTDRLIFALDVDDEARARNLVTVLRPEVGTFKVGLELLLRGGMELVTRILEGAEVFIDAKIHDVPMTVTRAVRQVIAGGVRVKYITVHDGVPEAVAAAQGRAGVLLVTVLTSVSPECESHLDELTERVVARAVMAQRDGAVGVVCSPREAQRVRAAVGSGFAVVTPAVRPAWAVVPGDDQKRTATVEEAIRAGASHVVVGRPIRDATSPKDAARRVVDEIAEALTGNIQPVPKGSPCQS